MKFQANSCIYFFRTFQICRFTGSLIVKQPKHCAILSTYVMTRTSLRSPWLNMYKRDIYGYAKLHLIPISLTKTAIDAKLCKIRYFLALLQNCKLFKQKTTQYWEKCSQFLLTAKFFYAKFCNSKWIIFVLYHGY